jgi:hypothetical protein
MTIAEFSGRRFCCEILSVNIGCDYSIKMYVSTRAQFLNSKMDIGYTTAWPKRAKKCQETPI